VQSPAFRRAQGAGLTDPPPAPAWGFVARSGQLTSRERPDLVDVRAAIGVAPPAVETVHPEAAQQHVEVAAAAEPVVAGAAVQVVDAAAAKGSPASLAFGAERRPSFGPTACRLRRSASVAVLERAALAKLGHPLFEDESGDLLRCDEILQVERQASERLPAVDHEEVAGDPLRQR
jgi:hypothetical protein